MGGGSHNRNACCPPFGISSPVSSVIFKEDSDVAVVSNSNLVSNFVDDIDFEGCNSHKKGLLVHSVSKNDNLPGLAIRYGVEVMDIKRINRLVNDFDIHALNTLFIPFPGSHPPSPIHQPSSPVIISKSNRFQESITPLKLPPVDLNHKPNIRSFKHMNSVEKNHNVSKAMALLMGYYGLNSPLKHEQKQDKSMNESNIKRTHSEIETTSNSECLMNSNSSSTLSRWALPDEDHTDHNYHTNHFNHGDQNLNDIRLISEDDHYFLCSSFSSSSSFDSIPTTSQCSESDASCAYHFRPFDNPSLPCTTQIQQLTSGMQKSHSDDRNMNKLRQFNDFSMDKHHTNADVSNSSLSCISPSFYSSSSCSEVKNVSRNEKKEIKMDPVVAVMEEMVKVHEKNYKATALLSKSSEENELKSNQSIRRRGKSENNINHSYNATMDKSSSSLSISEGEKCKKGLYSNLYGGDLTIGDRSNDLNTTVRNLRERRVKSIESIEFDKNKSIKASS